MGSSQLYYFHLLFRCQHYGFDMEKPFDKLSQQHRDIILYGRTARKRIFLT